MGNTLRKVVLVTLLLAVFTGCASEANRGTRVAGGAKGAKLALDQVPPPTLPLVVIRYPSSARIDPANRAALFGACRRSWPDASDEQIESAISEELSKTQYYVLEFYRVLSGRLPKGSVLLSPAIIDTDLRLKDVIAPPPHVLQVDMSLAVSWHRFISNVTFGPDTSGNKLSPVIQVLFRDAASVDTVYSKRRFAERLATPAALKRLPDPDVVLTTWQREYGAAPAVYKKTLLPALKKVNGVPLENGVFFGFAGVPAQGWWVPGNDLRRQLKPASGADQRLMPTEGLWQSFADAIVATLNTLDWDRTASRRMDAFCNDMGMATLPPEDRNEVLAALIPAETELIVMQDRTVSEMLYGSEFGSSLRSQFLAEVDVLDQLDASRNNQGFWNTVALVAAGASVGMQYHAASTGTLTPQLNQQVMNNLQQSQQLMDTVNATEAAFRSEVQGQLTAFRQRLSASQIEVVLNTSRGQFTIRGEGLSDIRSKVRDKIREVFGLPEKTVAEIGDGGGVEGQAISRSHQE